VVGSTGFDKAIVLRYDGAGALDPTFGGDGVVITPLDGSFEGWNGVDIRDGGIVAVGPGSPKGTLSAAGFAVARYEPGGPLDSAFGGGDGLSFTVFDAGFDVASSTRASDVAVQTDGRIVAAGTTAADGRQSDIAVTRLGPRASAVLARPDAEVGVRGDFVGNDRYNTTGFGQIIARKIGPGRSATFQVRLGNDGNAPDFITANPRHARGVTVKYLDHGENITRQMAFGEYGDRLPPGGTTTIKAVVTVRRHTNPGTVSVVRVGASSLNDLAKLDVVAMKIVVI
jgi:hypothetical protein